MKKKRMGCEVLFIASRLQATWHAPIGRNTIITAVIISTLKSSDGTVPKNGSYKKHFKFPHEMLHNLIVEPGQQKAPRIHFDRRTGTKGFHPELRTPGPTRIRRPKHKATILARTYSGKETKENSGGQTQKFNPYPDLPGQGDMDRTTTLTQVYPGKEAKENLSGSIRVEEQQQSPTSHSDQPGHSTPSHRRSI